MPKLAELNELDRETFTRVVGPAFEHSPWIAERTWSQGPFANVEALHSALCKTVELASADERLSLIRAHPDLVGRAITRESRDEQASAGLDAISDDEASQFQNYNAEYRQRFDFPFVICARLNNKEAILRAFTERLRNSPADELQTAVEEIFKIARLRLNELLT
jgi:2-oxo-4-hydroxy-4-carboxy-5-ureidoimidazoline decarboxylase